MLYLVHFQFSMFHLVHVFQFGMYSLVHDLCQIFALASIDCMNSEGALKRFAISFNLYLGPFQC